MLSSFREGNKKRKEDDKQEKEMQMKFLIDKLGAKLANLVIYLKNLFATDSSARVIVFSQVKKKEKKERKRRKE